MDATTAALIGFGLLLLAFVIIAIIAMWRGYLFTGEGKVAGQTVTVALTREVTKSITDSLKEANKEKSGSGQEVARAERTLAQAEEVRRGRILWVDDLPDLNAEEMVMLSNAGQSIVTVTDTPWAEKLLKRWPFDVVITDLTRGEDPTRGFGTIEAVKHHRPGTPVLVYTMDPGDRAGEAIALGAAGVFTTPGPLLQAVLDILVPADRGAKAPL